MSIYLMPTRDGGKTFDLDWVYAETPLISRGLCNQVGSTCAFDHGYMQAASDFVTVNDTHWLFYEGRPERHEDRWKKPATIAVATWPRHRFAALEPSFDCAKQAATNNTLPDNTSSTQSRCGVVVTKQFRLLGSHLYINAAVGADSRIVVALLTSDPKGTYHEVKGFDEKNAAPIGSTKDSLDIRVSWNGSELSKLHGKHVHILFRLCGDARLYAFTIKP